MDEAALPDLLRELIVSPELVGRLRALFAPGSAAEGAGEPSLPVATVVGHLLALELDLGKTAEVALDLVVQATKAERGFLVLQDGARRFGRRGGPEEPPEASHGVLREVETTRKTVLVADAATDPRFGGRDSVIAKGIRSVLCVPVLAPGAAPGAEGLVGAIYLDAPSEAGRFGARERALAEALAASFGPALRNARRFDEQRVELLRARRSAREGPGASGAGQRLIGRSAAMRELEQLLDRVAPGQHTVLVTGESGSGKELVARAIHARSRRATGPFVAENVGALSASLVEPELFGFTKGSFTGADESRPGLFQLADGGTLFLDEVGEMTLDLQKKLLRVLQEREVRPVGGSGSVKVDVRVVAATHRDLKQLIQAGTFREDLYYRLAVVTIRVPPLRERAEDVTVLLEHFVDAAARAQGVPRPTLSAEVLARATKHAWPGNVRELQGYATRLVLEGPQAELGPLTGASDLLPRLDLLGPSSKIVSLREARAEFDRAYIGVVLRRCDGNVSAAAEALGMTRPHLSLMVKKLGLRDRQEP